MRITRLNIKRFGFIRDEKLDDIGPGIVVIGGHNRAGKSTFMEILRHLGYGFQSVPFQDKLDFEVDADICMQSKEMLNISVKGLAEPRVRALRESDREFSSADVYQGLDQFTYKRLFTINLDELQKIPPELEHKEAARLQSVLLGAGLSEMLYLPQMEKKFLKEAYDIGGTKGKPGVKEFKPYHASIDSALKLKEAALLEVEEYYQKKQEYDLSTTEIEIIKNSSIPGKETELTKIETLDNLYETLEEKLRLDNEMVKMIGPADKLCDTDDFILPGKVEELKNDYQKARDNYRHNMKEFRKKISVGTKAEEIKQALLQNKEKIDGFFTELSGLKACTAAFADARNKLVQEITDIQDEMNKLNRSWDGDFHCLEGIKTDVIRRDQLNQSISEYQDTGNYLRDLEMKLDELHSEKEQLESHLNNRKDAEPEAVMNKYLVLSLSIAVLGGVSAVLINFWLGLFIGIAGIGGMVIYFINKSIVSSSQQTAQSNLDMELRRIQPAIDMKEQQIKQAEEKHKLQRENLDYYIEKLGLKKDISPDLISEYFRDVQSLQMRIGKVKQAENELRQQEEYLGQRFADIEAVICYLPTGIFSNNQDIFGKEINVDREAWFAGIESLKECLDAAEKCELSQRSMSEQEEKIEELCRTHETDNSGDIEDMLDKLKQDAGDYIQFNELNKRLESCDDRIIFELKKAPIIKAFDFANSDEKSKIASLKEYYHLFASGREVHAYFEQVQQELKAMKEDLDGVQKDNQRLLHELNRLSTTDKIEHAMQEIREARSNLRPLAEKYAVNRAAAFILGRARERMLERTKNQSLNRAGEIFSRITRGEYQKILPADELTRADFKTVSSSNINQETVDILSRGTREQLFLAVRISRIKELAALPITIDDCLVNCDINHLGQVMRVMIDLSSAQQIFVLTCHPQMIRCIAEQTDHAQYWKLERGKFSLSSSQDMMIYLSN